MALVAAGAHPGTAVASARDSSSAPTRTSTAPASSQVLVRFTSTATAADRLAAVSAVGGRDVGTVYGTSVRIVAVGPGQGEAAAAALARVRGVAGAEPDRTRTLSLTPNDPRFPNQTGPAQVGSLAAWDVTTGDPSTVIAVVDTGVDTNHPDLAARAVPGWDFVNNDADPADDHGHGTKVAGVAAATGNNAIGVSGYCMRCSVMPVKVANANGSAYDSAISSGIRWATDRGARVINLSLGGPGSSSTEAAAVAYALERGVVVVAAAGNDGTTTVNYPAGYAGVVSVAAVTTSDALYTWSNRGSWVSLAAPGCTHTTAPGSSYSSFCGTSSASPAAAGVIANALTAADGFTPSAVGQILAWTSVAIGPSIGGGRISADAFTHAITSARGTPTSTPAPDPTPAPTLDTTAPSAPTLTMTSAKNGVGLSWTAAIDDVGVQNYTVLRDGGVLAVLPAGTLNFKDSSASAGTTYQVVARDAAGNAAPSNSVVVTAAEPKPGKAGGRK